MKNGYLHRFLESFFDFLGVYAAAIVYLVVAGVLVLSIWGLLRLFGV